MVLGRAFLQSEREDTKEIRITWKGVWKSEFYINTSVLFSNNGFRLQIKFALVLMGRAQYINDDTDYTFNQNDFKCSLSQGKCQVSRKLF